MLREQPPVLRPPHPALLDAHPALRFPCLPLPAGEAEEEGYEDEYQLEDTEVGGQGISGTGQGWALLRRCGCWAALALCAPILLLCSPALPPACRHAPAPAPPLPPQVAAADYIKPCFTPNFRAAWDALPEESEMVDDYGIGQRDSLQVTRHGALLLGHGAGSGGQGELLQKRWLPGAAGSRGRHGDRGTGSLEPAWGSREHSALRPCGQLAWSPPPLRTSLAHLTPWPVLLQDAVEAVGRILGMQACEGTDAVPPNARSHTLLLSGTVVGDAQVGSCARRGGGVCCSRGGGLVQLARASAGCSAFPPLHAMLLAMGPLHFLPALRGGPQVLVRLAFGIDAQRNVAMKLAVRSESPEVSEAIHAIIQEA